MYELRDVTKRYDTARGPVVALDNVNLSIPSGEWLAIQGPTGQGKSTLLQMLGGLDRPTQGTVLLDDIDLAKASEVEMSRLRARRIGFIFQTFNLIPTLSAQENVETALVPLGIEGSGRISRQKIQTVSLVFGH